jgi:hypothetical protein
MLNIRDKRLGRRAVRDVRSACSPIADGDQEKNELNREFKKRH